MSVIDWLDNDNGWICVAPQVLVLFETGVSVYS